MTRLGALVLDMRKRHQMKQAELARFLKVDRSVVCHLEHGTCPTPLPPFIAKLADVLGVEYRDLANAAVSDIHDRIKLKYGVAS